MAFKSRTTGRVSLWLVGKLNLWQALSKAATSALALVACSQQSVTFTVYKCDEIYTVVLRRNVGSSLWIVTYLLIVDANKYGTPLADVKAARFTSSPLATSLAYSAILARPLQIRSDNRAGATARSAAGRAGCTGSERSPSHKGMAAVTRPRDASSQRALFNVRCKNAIYDLIAGRAGQHAPSVRSANGSWESRTLLYRDATRRLLFTATLYILYCMRWHRIGTGLNSSWFSAYCIRPTRHVPYITHNTRMTLTRLPTSNYALDFFNRPSERHSNYTRGGFQTSTSTSISDWQIARKIYRRKELSRSHWNIFLPII